MTAALSGATRDEMIFGKPASVFGICRRAVMQEGGLLEDSTALPYDTIAALALPQPAPRGFEETRRIDDRPR
jgi:hypothetical protein